MLFVGLKTICSTESRHFPAVAERGRRRKAILELGAGTGICGMAACSILGWPVIMTDREDDVIGNLKNNVALNGMEYSARVVRLEWGEGRGGGVEKGLPAEVEEQKPFQARFWTFHGVDSSNGSVFNFIESYGAVRQVRKDLVNMLLIVR